MHPPRCFKIFLYIISFNTTFINSHHVNDTYQLLRDKLLHYDKTIRPKINQSEPTVVYFTISLLSLRELDEVNQIMTVVAVTPLTWTDELLRWSPSDYGNMTQLRTESGQFWTPNLILVNSAEQQNEPATTKPIVIQSNGLVTIFPTDSFTISCDMDLTAYPLDRHICTLVLSSQLYDISELLIQNTQQKVNVDYFSFHGAWDLQDTRIEAFSTTYFSNVQIYLSFERRSRFLIINVLLPTIFLSFLSIFVFLIPSDSGERISYSLTILLAVAVFLTLVGDNLPKISTFMPVFNYYIIAMLAMCVSITIATIFNLRLFHSDDTDPVPKRLTNVIRRCSKRAILKHKISQALPDVKKGMSSKDAESLQISRDSNMKINESSTLQNGHNLCELQQSKIAEVEAKLDCPAEESIYPGNTVTWKDASSAFDILLFLSFLAIFILATVTYFVVVFRNRRLTIEDVLKIVKMKLNIDA